MVWLIWAALFYSVPPKNEILLGYEECHQIFAFGLRVSVPSAGARSLERVCVSFSVHVLVVGLHSEF